MKAFLLSFRSEFYKSKNTLAFWGAIILPVFLCTVVFLGYYFKADKILKSIGSLPPMALWFNYLSSILNVMGILLMPVYLIFMTFSVNSIEHKAETWKSLFSLPIPKATVYYSKASYTLLLVLLSMVLFVVLSLAYGVLLSGLNPKYHFLEADMIDISTKLCQIYAKLYLASLGIVAIQFLLSLVWSDFLKPMGLGFILLVIGIIANRWEYSYLIPFALPLKSLAISGKEIIIFTKEIWVSIAYAFTFFALGYFVITKRSVK